MVIALPVLLICLSLVVDLAGLEITKGRMQAANDAAALAGATWLPDEVEALRQCMVLTKDNGFENGAGDVIVTGACSDKFPDGYQVDIEKEYSTFIFNYTFQILTTATAIKGPPPCYLEGHLMPFCIINPNTNHDPRDDLSPGKWGKRYILLFGEENLLIQDWANGNLPVGEDAPGTGPDYSKNNSEGWRAALRLDLTGFDIGGADAFTYNFLNGWPGKAEIGDHLPVETGNIAGPVFITRDERLCGEEDFDFNNFDPNRDYNMKRVVHIAVVSLLRNDLSGRYTIDDYYAGRDWNHKYVIIDGFAPFYLLTLNEMGDVDGDGQAKDKDWIVGLYIPGTRIPMFSYKGCDDYGAVTWARLVE